MFFDSLGLRWEYEPEGYELGGGVRYLPDFLLVDLRCWVEIKGSEGDYDRDASEKAERLAAGTGMPVFVFYGGHIVPPAGPGVLGEDVTWAYAYFATGGGDQPYAFCECPDCGQIGIQYDGRADRLQCKADYLAWMDYRDGKADRPAGCPRHGGNFDKGYNANSPRLIEAYTRARKVRFGRW